MEIGYIKEQRLYAFDIHSIPFKKNETIYDGFLFSVRDKLTCSDEIKQFTTKEDCKKWAELVYKRFLEDKFL